MLRSRGLGSWFIAVGMISAVQRQSIDMVEGAMLRPQSSGHDLLECSDGERDELVAVVDDIFGGTNCREPHLALVSKNRCALVRRECRHTVRHS